MEEKEAYEKRIVAESIDGIYIPKNLEECFLELNKLLKPKHIKEIKNLKYKVEVIIYHQELGRWMRNNWGLWEGSRLKQHLVEKGLGIPDNMSQIILEFYYDWLNGRNEEWKEFEKE